jgi:hypothetical protein
MAVALSGRPQPGPGDKLTFLSINLYVNPD